MNKTLPTHKALKSLRLQLAWRLILDGALQLATPTLALTAALIFIWRLLQPEATIPFGALLTLSLAAAVTGAYLYLRRLPEPPELLALLDNLNHAGGSLLLPSQISTQELDLPTVRWSAGQRFSLLACASLFALLAAYLPLHYLQPSTQKFEIDSKIEELHEIVETLTEEDILLQQVANELHKQLKMLCRKNKR